MSLIGTPLTIHRLESDLVIWMADNSREYCCTSIKLTNATSAAVEHKVGEVVASATLSSNADLKTLQGDFTDALLLKHCYVPANSTLDVPALVRGPARVNFNEVERTSADETDASVRSRIANLVAKGVQFVLEPAVQTAVDLNG